MSLKVAMVADHPLDPLRIDGGVQAATYYLANALATLPDIDLHVVTFRGGINDHQVTTETGYVIHYVPRARFGASTRWLADRSALRRLLERIRPDVVHGQGIGADGWMATKSGLPSVVTVHGILSIDAKFRSRRLDRWRLGAQGALTEGYCIRHAQHLIVISEYVRSLFGETARGEQHYIPNPTPSTFYGVRRTPQSGRILFAGKLSPLKGVSLLIEAVARLPSSNVHLVLAGSAADPAYLASLREAVAAHGLDQSVTFCGLLDEARLLDEFERAELLVLPSFQENAPMVIQQAMAAGLPVVATDVGDVSRMLGDEARVALVPPGKVEALSKAIAHVLEDVELRDRLSRSGIERAVGWSSIRVAERTRDVYQAAASAGPRFRD